MDVRVVAHSKVSAGSAASRRRAARVRLIIAWSRAGGLANSPPQMGEQVASAIVSTDTQPVSLRGCEPPRETLEVWIEEAM